MSHNVRLNRCLEPTRRSKVNSNEVDEVRVDVSRTILWVLWVIGSVKEEYSIVNILFYEWFYVLAVQRSLRCGTGPSPVGASCALYGSGGAGDLAVHFCLPQPIWLFLLHSLPFIIVVAAQPFPLSLIWLAFLCLAFHSAVAP